MLPESSSTNITLGCTAVLEEVVRGAVAMLVDAPWVFKATALNTSTRTLFFSNPLMVMACSRCSLQGDYPLDITHVIARSGDARCDSIIDLVGVLQCDNARPLAAAG